GRAEPTHRARDRSMNGAPGTRRRGAVAKGPRVIDLDLLLFGDAVMEGEELTLPHPEMQGRAVCARAAGGDCAGVGASGVGGDGRGVA
ncbi:MAG: 2-amino-4-hydroxy-6-hydroxymethyldihydropteridine diphosphokinase, partial [Edaphobacter sp.]